MITFSKSSPRRVRTRAIFGTATAIFAVEESSFDFRSRVHDIPCHLWHWDSLDDKRPSVNRMGWW